MATMTQPSDIQVDSRTRQCRFCGSGLQRTFVDLGLVSTVRDLSSSFRLPAR